MRCRGYSVVGIIYLFICYLYTKLTWPQARLIRLPFRGIHRGRVAGMQGFTAGVGARIDVFEEGNLNIGEGVQINDYVHIACALTIVIGENCLIASRVFISDHDHNFRDGQDLPPKDWTLATEKVVIGSGCWVGEGAAILKGVELGDGCVVGANSVVTKSFPKNCILAGVPAKIISVR